MGKKCLNIDSSNLINKIWLSTLNYNWKNYKRTRESYKKKELKKLT